MRIFLNKIAVRLIIVVFLATITRLHEKAIKQSLTLRDRTAPRQSRDRFFGNIALTEGNAEETSAYVVPLWDSIPVLT
ncbi:hypothetical protein H1P_740010 [Hyella patelloides LEGE 07179]|uniref:Uncharacterized protein n=1 Tax=Hyella patelloides LEGE 07179 TaxID=945734 RepID=A0A563W3Q1_9CYAN|nr:hypothetical protein [Hyella patelloides]VEP18298.1 hypothetical protein H1P_740010 [Hyella patelloides LEGE 07179]